jgi:flavin reductase (DIM6/NTAB) family NADH-FMN oxidoreductase RutF
VTPVDEAGFRAAMGSFATGVCVVAARDPRGAPIAFTASSLASVSLDPFLLLFCLGRDSTLYGLFPYVGTFSVSVLKADQQSVSRAFAADARAWFETGRWSWGEEGAPVLEERLAALECRVERVDDGGDHVIVIGRVLRADCGAGEPLLHFRGDYRGLG